MAKTNDLIADIASSKNIPEDYIKESLLKAILYGYRIDLYKNVKSASKEELEVEKDSKKLDTLDDLEARIEINKKGKVFVYVSKTVTKKPKLLLREINISGAHKINHEAEVGDKVDVEVDFLNLPRNVIKEIQKKFDEELRSYSISKIYDQLSQKLYKLVPAKIQRITPRAMYATIEDFQLECTILNNDIWKGEKIKVGDSKLFYIYKINKILNKRKNSRDYGGSNYDMPLEVLLTRTKSEFIQKIFEAEIPEIVNQEIKIVKIAREVGYKTKVLVSALKDGIEPVGACLGIKGYRIQNIRKEIGGEVVEVILYTEDPAELIKNTLNLEKLMETSRRCQVLTISSEKRMAIVVVPDQDAQANVIGKDGINVKLAVELTNWKIDIKTEEEFENSEYAKLKSVMFDSVFNDIKPEAAEAESQYEEVSEEADIDELAEYLGHEIIAKLKSSGIETIEKLIDYSSAGRLQTLSKLSTEDFLKIEKFIDENVEIEEEEEIEEKEIAICPNCNNEIPADAEKCPYCGLELED